MTQSSSMYSDSPNESISHSMLETLRNLWSTRPLRLRKQSHPGIAGVCEGIGVRYQVDPLIVRCIFIIAGFSGTGLVVYALFWLLLPRHPLTPSVFEWLHLKRHSSRLQKSTKPKKAHEQLFGFLFLFCFALITLVIISGFTALQLIFHTMHFLLWFALWLWLYYRTPLPPSNLCPNHASEPHLSGDHDAQSEDHSHFTPSSGTSNSCAYEVDLSEYLDTTLEQAPAPQWDPLDETLPTWNIAQPQSTKSKQQKRPRRLVPLALMATLVLLMAFFSGVSLPSNRITNEGYGDSTHTFAGLLRIAPTSPTQLYSNYTLDIGVIIADFQNITLQQEDVDVTLTNSFGVINIHVPDSLHLHVTCDKQLSSEQCAEQELNPLTTSATLHLHIKGEHTRIHINGETPTQMPNTTPETTPTSVTTTPPSSTKAPESYDPGA